MKKLALLAAAGMMTLAACQENNGYTVDGIVANGTDGDYVYLTTIGRNTEVLDSALIKGGKFQFKGTPEVTALPKAVAYTAQEGKIAAMLFLEKGTINVVLDKENPSVGGTESNEALRSFMAEYKKQSEEMREIYNSYRKDSTLTDNQRKELVEQLNKKDEEQQEFVIDQLSANITKPFGAYLLVSFGSGLDPEKLEALLPQVPAELASDESIVRLKDFVQNCQNTAVGKKFVDFSMKTPEGKDVKLSDFIGKDKYVLIDFWASWCGPCRQEMPVVVEAYKKFKSKGFGVVGVSLDQDADRWQKSIKDLNITWAQMSDLKGWQCEGAKLYGVQGIPATVLVDQDGIIVERNLRGEDLLKKLDELFN